MNRDQILRELRDERDRLSKAIAALEGAAGGAVSRTSGAKARSGGITAAGRKRLSEMMKKRWAERRKAAKR